MLSQTLRLPAGTSEAELLALIDELNADDTVDGILVQLPLPPQITEKRVLDRISPDKDVDGFHPISVGRLWLDEAGLHPRDPHRHRRPAQAQRHPARRPAGGDRRAAAPSSASRWPGCCCARTARSPSATRAPPDLAAVTREADILVAAIGRAGMIGPDHVREGAVVVDVGINRLADAAEAERLFPGDEARRQQVASKGYILVGDVDFTRVAPKASAHHPGARRRRAADRRDGHRQHAQGRPPAAGAPGRAMNALSGSA